MMVKIKKIFLFSFVLILSLSFIFACSPPGPIDATYYCGTDGISYFLLEEGEECLNDYECLVGSCSEGTCGSAFSGVPDDLEESENFLSLVWNFLTGEQCTPGGPECIEGEENIFCGDVCFEGELIRTCGALRTWEDNEGELPAVVDGKCIEPTYCGDGIWQSLNDDGFAEECDGVDNCTGCLCDENYIADMSGNCEENISGQECSFMGEEKCVGVYLFKCNIYLKWIDLGEDEICYTDPNTPNGNGNGCTPDWKCTGWSLGNCGTRICIDSNSCRTIVGKPLQTKDCSDSSYCGDGVCGIYEDCGNSNNPPECVSDCGACAIGTCGDGVCDADESSYLCPEDCEPVKPVSKLWIFILIIILLVVGIIAVVFLIIRKLKKSKQNLSFGQGNVAPSQPRMPPRTPPASVARGYPVQAHSVGFHT